MHPILAILEQSWSVLEESALYMLIGFLAAGLLKAFLPDNLVARHLGRNRTSNVIKASLLGVPIPLCSCGVVPAAAGLRRQGASRGATTSFLVSTPETGVDSIAVTYALLDPVMTIIRPIAAFITAVFAGILVNVGSKNDTEHEPLGKDLPMGSACNGACCGVGNKPCRPGFLSRFKSGMAYAYGDLFNDVALWFLLGVLLAGAISALVPAGALEAALGQGFLSMLIMLAIGIPLYVCATSSTPIVAALALKGLSPGAALVFLLAGPATNMASLAMVAKIIGRRATLFYLASIILSSLLLGLAVNALYTRLGLDITTWVSSGPGKEHSVLHLLAAILLLALLLKALIPAAVRLLKRLQSSHGRRHGSQSTHHEPL